MPLPNWMWPMISSPEFRMTFARTVAAARSWRCSDWPCASSSSGHSFAPARGPGPASGPRRRLVVAVFVPGLVGRLEEADHLDLVGSDRDTGPGRRRPRGSPRPIWPLRRRPPSISTWTARRLSTDPMPPPMPPAMPRPCRPPPMPPIWAKVAAARGEGHRREPSRSIHDGPPDGR